MQYWNIIRFERWKQQEKRMYLGLRAGSGYIEMWRQYGFNEWREDTRNERVIIHFAQWRIRLALKCFFDQPQTTLRHWL